MTHQVVSHEADALLDICTEGEGSILTNWVKRHDQCAGAAITGGCCS